MAVSAIDESSAGPSTRVGRRVARATRGLARRLGHRPDTGARHARSTPVGIDTPAPGVLRLHLGDGQRRNVLGREAVDGIDAVAAEPPDGCRVLLVTAEPPDFCAGYDLHEAQRTGAESLIAHGSNFEALRRSKLPVVAALRGNVIGGGLELALAADVRLAASDTRFSIPAGRLGVVYSEAGTRLLVEELGESLARAMLIGGIAVSAEQALAIGFISEVVPTEQLDARAIDVATSIASWSPVATSGNRRVLDTVTGRRAEDLEALRLESFEPAGALMANIEHFTASHPGVAVVTGIDPRATRLARARAALEKRLRARLERSPQAGG